MIIDRFTKFSLSILVFSLCLNALNPWLSPTLANAEIEDTEVKNAMKIIAQGINRIAAVYERQEQRDIIRYERQERLDIIRYEKQEQRALKQEQRALKSERANLMQRAQKVRITQGLDVTTQGLEVNDIE